MYFLLPYYEKSRNEKSRNTFFIAFEGERIFERRQGHAFCCDFAVRIRLIHIANGNEVKKVQTSATACAASRPVMPQSHDMMKTAGRKYKP